MTLEQNTLTRLLRFLAHASSGTAQLGKKEEPPPDEPVENADEAAAAAQRDEGPRVYIKELRLHPIVVKVTVELAALTDEPELQAYHPTRKLVGLAKNLASVNNATIKLDALHLDEASLTVGALAERLQWHYTMQASGARAPEPTTRC